jgi:hypothetical protein
MKKIVGLSIIVGALLGLAGWSGYAQGQRTLPPRGGWEYRVDPIPGVERSLRMATEFDKEVVGRNREADENLINERAAQGWELTAVGGLYYYFRRAR